ncbi:MAG: DNA-binding protein Alba [Candidatus Aenigmarchaeota archaeon]|jgi:DNA-binding protein|nr:DNA-binding protein Alba [Candidatus Aenigmarchaeota archaeon]
MADDNTVFVGSKPPMNYVLAVITQFHNGAKKVEIKARGRAISRAVDVAEIVRNKFMSDLKVDNITTGTEELQGERGDKLNVSSMTITLTKESSKKK